MCYFSVILRVNSIFISPEFARNKSKNSFDLCGMNHLNFKIPHVKTEVSKFSRRIRKGAFMLILFSSAHMVYAQSIDSFREQLDMAPSVVSSSSATSSADSFSYKRGATYEESILPATPQAVSAVRNNDAQLAYSTGAAMVDIPIYTMQGKELRIPIGLNYRSNGIKLSEIAGVAGLGWSLEAGGCITRSVMDMPDEFSSFYMEHSMPSGSLLSDLEGDVNNASTLLYLRSVCRHKIDSKLDRYNYNVCGLTGSFVIVKGAVAQLNGDGVLIDYTCTGDKFDYMEGGSMEGQSPEVENFIVTGPDGNIYTFSEKEVGEHDGTKANSSPSPITGEVDKWSATTAWYLTSVKSASGLEQAIFTYKDGLEWDRSVVTYSQTKTSKTTLADQDPLTSEITTIG